MLRDVENLGYEAFQLGAGKARKLLQINSVACS